MKKINIGIIGSGFIIPVFIEVSKMFEDYHLRAIWGRHEEKLLQFKDEVDYYTTDLEKVLSDEEIDAIYVALPNSLHYQYAMEALKHGKHVILEKPFTVYYKDAKKLIADMPAVIQESEDWVPVPAAEEPELAAWLG